MTKMLAICKRVMFVQAVQSHLSNNDIELVFVCTHPVIALRSYQSLQPDIVLMDANWSHPVYLMSGIDLVQSLIDFDPAVRIIVTSTIHEPLLLERMKAAGVKGYFSKIGKNVLHEIIICIKIVHDGGSYYGPSGPVLHKEL
ncbi:MAG: response regulator [Agriterribacter sp.]